MKALIFLVIFGSVVSSQAASQKCSTANDEYQKITCSLKDVKTHEKIHVKIQCDQGHYVYSKDGEAFTPVARVRTAETMEPSNQELSEYLLANGEGVFIESNNLLTRTSHYFKGEFWINGDNEEAAHGHCWVF